MIATSSRAELSFEQTVPRRLAHRSALGEVFIADSVETDDGDFLLAVQVPRAHSLWFDRRVGYHDPLSTAEAARQGVFVIVHRHLGVPHGLPFSLRSLRFEIEDLEAYRDDGRSPLEAILRYRLSESKGAGELGGMSFDGDLTISGRLAMTIGGQVLFLPTADYEALRSYQRAHRPLDAGRPSDAPRPLDPTLVGRFDERNVVLGEPTARAGALRYPIVVDPSHPSFFDHSYDHVPGPLIVEAYRQAAVLAATRKGALLSPVAAVTKCEASFSDFAELDALLECSASRVDAFEGGRVAAAVDLHQFGKRIATSRMELSPYQ